MFSVLFFSHRFQSLYNYTPRNEDELELREGDVIDVMEKCDDGWFVGKHCLLFSNQKQYQYLSI